MAYTRRKPAKRRPRSTSRRTYARPVRRRSASRAPARGGSQTLRIVLEQPSPAQPAVSDGQIIPVSPKKARF